MGGGVGFAFVFKLHYSEEKSRMGESFTTEKLLLWDFNRRIFYFFFFKKYSLLSKTRLSTPQVHEAITDQALNSPSGLTLGLPGAFQTERGKYYFLKKTKNQKKKTP